ncbi:MAG: family transcriptional regulator [Phycisphaerales bacterium]|nr:family transcriptional regulator [Phycisphaerales bacterium]
MAKTTAPLSNSPEVGKPVLINPREQLFASMVWRQAGLSRRDLHERTGTHPTLTGHAVTNLIDIGLLREGAVPPTNARGRPQVPLEVDPDRRTFIGLAIAPGGVRGIRANALGRPRGEEVAVVSKTKQNPIASAAALLKRLLDPTVFAVGVSITGLALPREAKVLFSSALAATESVSVRPIYAAADETPVVLHNDMHALSLKWLMTNDNTDGDVLLVGVEDGRLGASLLLGGRPHGGVVGGANELGHTRLAVETAPCYCGQQGCLERIVSTEQLSRFGLRSSRSLDAVLANPKSDRRAAERVLNLLANGIANAVNFIRPQRLIVASPLVRHPIVSETLSNALPPLFLPGLRERVSVRLWEQSNVQSAENAAWLALAEVFGRPPATME